MATDNTTGEVKNYLGHPCTITPLLRQSEDWPEYAKARAQDPRAQVQDVGKLLAELNSRTACTHDVLQRTHTIAEHIGGDAQELEGMLAVSEEYALNTANLFFDLSCQVLALLERADLIKPSQQPVEAAHA